MKSRIYAIVLLLSFLVVYSHQVIPHHHHDYEMDELSSFHAHDDAHQYHADHRHHHHEGESHNHHHPEEPTSDHNHSYPLHHHLSEANDLDLLRIDLNKKIEIKFSLLYAIFFKSDILLSDPPELDVLCLTDPPFLISSTYEPGALGLRAPPSIA